MTPVELLIAGLFVLRLTLVRRAGGGLLAEAIADSTLALPVFLLQEARLFYAQAWSLTIPGGVPVFAVVYGVALLGIAVTLSERLAASWQRDARRPLNPWAIAGVDLVVLAVLTAIGETVLFLAGAWEYRFASTLGTIPALGIPWAAAAGASGFGLFFATTIRQFRRWATDAVGRLAVHGRAVFGLAHPAPGTILAGGALIGLGFRRTLGTAVFRFLDL